jgi:hypothetical protein
MLRDFKLLQLWYAFAPIEESCEGRWYSILVGIVVVVTVQPVGIYLVPRDWGSVVGQANVPEEATFFTQLVVAFVGFQAEKLTLMLFSLVQS